MLKQANYYQFVQWSFAPEDFVDILNLVQMYE